MLSLSSLIEFLLDMMRDPTTQNDYARDPNGTLAARGLSGVTAQDVHDVQPLLADHQGVSASVGGAHAARSTLLDHSYGHHYAGLSPRATPRASPPATAVTTRPTTRRRRSTTSRTPTRWTTPRSSGT